MPNPYLQTNLTWQAVRDFGLTMLPIVGVAVLNFSTDYVQNHPTVFAAATPLVLLGLTLLRRAWNPTVPVADVK